MDYVKKRVGAWQADSDAFKVETIIVKPGLAISVSAAVFPRRSLSGVRKLASPIALGAARIPRLGVIGSIRVP